MGRTRRYEAVRDAEKPGSRIRAIVSDLRTVSEVHPALRARARQSYEASLSGDPGDVAATLAALAMVPDAEACAWHAALSASAWMLAPEAYERPSESTLATLVQAPPEARRVAALALTHLERASAVAFDLDELSRQVALHEELGRGLGDETAAPLWLEAARSWRALLAGHAEGLVERTRELERLALSEKIGPLVIDACVLSALSASLAGDDEAGTAIARRASRMARTEALPQHEYLAHWSLARARRRSRHPHLAIRILTALERFAAPQFRGAIAWELLLAGDLAVSAALLARGGAGGRAEDAARALLASEEAALRGDRAAFESAADALAERARGASFAARDAEAWLFAADFRRRPPADAPALALFGSAQDASLPPELHGLCARRGAGEEGDPSEAYVLARPDAEPRRILGLGANLVDLPGAVRLRRTRRRQGRVEVMAAVVAAAGAPGIDAEAGFERAYGFRFEPELHKGVFEVLLHRLRAYVADVGELVREGGRLRLGLRAPALVPDPRCTGPHHDALLRVLAREGKTTASDAARHVGLSVRAVQEALRSLIEEGACASARDGRQIVYVVEDTTFSEPTERLAVTFRRRS